MARYLALGTRYSRTIESDGKACHASGSHRGNLNSARKAIVYRAAWNLAVATGLLDPETGIGMCCMCGAESVYGDDFTAPNVLELAHDVPDNTVRVEGYDYAASGHDGHRGAFCVCNLLPACLECNRALGDIPVGEAMDLYFDPRPFAFDFDLSGPAPKRVHMARGPQRGPSQWQARTARVASIAADAMA